MFGEALTILGTNFARAMFEIALAFSAVRGRRARRVSHELTSHWCLNRRHSQPRWLMVGQLRTIPLKNFPKLADFPLLLFLVLFVPLQSRQGNRRRFLSLSLKHLLQNEVERMELTQLKITSYHLRSVIIGDKLVRSLHFAGLLDTSRRE
jgi:hypothetical protein